MKKMIFTVFVLSASMLSVMAQTETVVIKTNLFCDHCLRCESCGPRIEIGLISQKGVKQVQIDDKNMTVTVRFNPEKIQPDAIRQALASQGFDADEIKAIPQAYNNLDACCKKKE
ncbi:MAG: heavy metal-associated domain-containing protein [Chitinophagales bacterium]|nr:heavy metal-associated domain-containing protein [Chitinophagales bacterium]